MSNCNCAIYETMKDRQMTSDVGSSLLFEDLSVHASLKNIYVYKKKTFFSAFGDVVFLPQCSRYLCILVSSSR